MQLKFGKDTTLEEILKKVSEAEEAELEIILDSDSPIFQNPLNYRVLEQIAAEKGKQIKLAEQTATGHIEEVKEEEMVDNLGFVEEGDSEGEKLTTEVLDESEPEAEVMTEETLTLTPNVVVPPAADIPKFGIENPQPLHPSPKDPVLLTEVPDEGVVKTKKGFALPVLNVAALKNIKLTRQQWLLVGGGVGLLFFIVLLWVVLPSAQVKLVVASQALEKSATVTATPRLNEIDVNSSSIPLTSVEVKQNGSLSTKATGRKNIGDPARGKITVRNYSTSSEKPLAKGTILRVVGKSLALEFSLDRAVTIPTGSASSSVDSSGRRVSVIDPGRIDVEATASKIGTEGNITSGTRLAVNNEGLDVVDGVATADFAGGSSKEVTVVSAADRSNLLATLSAQLADKAKSEIEAKLEESQKLPSGGIETSEIRKVFSRDIDQEATDLSLNLEIAAVASVYNEKDLAKLLAESLKADATEGFKVSEADTEATAEVLKVNEDKTVTLLSQVKTKLVPDFNNEEIAANLKGKKVDQARDYIKTINNVEDVEINLQPSFLNFMKTFPSNPKKIKIEIITKNN